MCVSPDCVLCSQGLDEEALVDHGKSSFTTNTNYEKEDLESEFKTFISLSLEEKANFKLSISHC